MDSTQAATGAGTGSNPATKGFSRSLRARLPLSILTIIMITLSFSTFYTVRTARSVLSYVKSNRIEDAAMTVGNSISVQLQRAGKDMTLIASLPMVLEGISISPANAPDPGDSFSRASLGAMLNRAKAASNYYESFWLMNENGEVVAGISDLADTALALSSREWQRRISEMSTFAVTRPIASRITGDMLMPVSLKLVYNGKAGALAGTLELTKVARDVLRDVGRSGVKSFIVDADGRVMACLDEQMRFRHFSAETWFDRVLQDVSGSMTAWIDKEDKTVGFYHIPHTDLYALVLADAAYMQSYVSTMQNAAIIASIVTAVLAVGCVCLFIFPVTGDIRRLSRFARQITRGAQQVAIGVDRQDELGDLADSLCDMVVTLQDMVAKSQAATQAKSEFLARMSHEIRTPMNGIIGMTYLAMREKPDAKQLNYLRRIDAAAKNLLGIINDILDFSKIEANKMEIASHSFRLSGMLRSVHDLVRVKAEEKGLHLEFTVAENVPDVLEGDSLRLAQVCINLCTNALKFTEQGHVKLRVDLQEASDAGITLRFTVQDTGIGLSDEAKLTIFDSFSQADGSTTRKYGGTGLGLTISKSLARMMGGDLWVESEQGAGSTFYFTVAVRPGQEQAIEELEAPQFQPEKPDPMNLLVLLAEDNELNQEIAVDVLKGLGVKTIVANNGAEAVQLWGTEPFDAILMDIQMPVMDGLTAARLIRKSALPRSQSVPIIAITANAMSGDKEKSLEAGMNDHITKPFNVEELRSALAHWTQ